MSAAALRGSNGGRRVGLRAVFAASVAFALCLFGLAPGSAVADTAPPSGSTDPATVSADALPTWQINGVVWAQVVVGNTVYATGRFTTARPPGSPVGGVGEITVGHLIAYDIRTGNRVTTFNHFLNAQGVSIAVSPDGSRLYVGGDFTAVDGVALHHIAAFDIASGQLLTSFMPYVDGQVKAIAATNQTVYVGGEFSGAAGFARQYAASFVASTGAITPWAPQASDGYVWSLVLVPDGSKVVVGGQFQTLNGTAVYGQGAVDPTTGASLPWAANAVIRDSIGGAIDSLTTDGTYVYGAGWAYGTGGTFEGTFSLNPADGSIRWLNDCHGDTYDTYPIGSVVYSVSHAHDCTPIGGYPETNPRVRWQHALASTNYPTGKNTGPDSYGWNFNGIPDAKLLQWYPDLGIGQATGQYQAAWSVKGNGSYVVLGGEFPTVNGVAQQGLTRFAVSSLAPNKIGPQYNTDPVARTVSPTTATVVGTGVQVRFATAWDKDNQRLRYDVNRDGGLIVCSTQVDTTFWVLPDSSCTDTAPGSGSHTYQVRITDAFGNTLLSSASNAVTVNTANQAPVASFASTATGLTVSFDGSASNDPDGTISAYQWAFGDGATATGATSQHTYAAAGTYQVTLTVTDNSGATNSLTKAVTVTAGNQPPVAAFTVTATGLSVAVDGSGSSDPDGTITAYTWAFGDGATGSGITTQHTYASVGSYKVTLTVTDNLGATNTVTKVVRVKGR